MPAFTPSPDLMDRLYALTDRLFTGTLGPAIRDDAKAGCPVFGGENSTATAASLAAAGDDYEPGALRDSIEDHLDGHTLIVAATGSEDRWYASFVELGHWVVAWGVPQYWKKPPQPFLMPALLTVRRP